MATKVLDLELTHGLRPVWGVEEYKELAALVRYRGQPLGWLRTPVHPPLVSVEQLLEAMTEQLEGELVSVFLAKQFDTGAASSVPLVPISVVVCTHSWAQQLGQCIQALLELDYPRYEIIVVGTPTCLDRAPQIDAHPLVRFVYQDQPGLNQTRNRGIAEARYDVVAFTENAARPERAWLRALAAGFADPEVVAVTGLVAPAELETPAQAHLSWGYARSGQLRHHRVRRSVLSDQELLWAKDFGSGANMAFRRDLFAAIGPFDVALDIGSASASSGDTEMLHRLVARGYTLVYEPAAVVWRTHSRDKASLHQQIFDRGRSFGAYLLTCMRNRTVGRFSVLHFAVSAWLGRWFLRCLLRRCRLRRYLVVIELTGALLSPLAYLVGQARARRVDVSQAGSEALESTVG